MILSKETQSDLPGQKPLTPGNVEPVSTIEAATKSLTEGHTATVNLGEIDIDLTDQSIPEAKRVQYVSDKILQTPTIAQAVSRAISQINQHVGVIMLEYKEKQTNKIGFVKLRVGK